VEAFGIIDRDNRSSQEISDLEAEDIFALNVCSVEGLFYGAVARKALAEEQAKRLNRDPNSLLQASEAAAIAAISSPDDKRRLCAARTERAFRDILIDLAPNAKAIECGNIKPLTADANSLMSSEMSHFSGLMDARDIDGLLARYQLRKTGFFPRFTKALLFQEREHYEDAVIALLEHEPEFRRTLATSLNPLAAKLTG
jgi:hypothetical protein